MRPRFLYALLIATGILLGGILSVIVENCYSLTIEPKLSIGEAINSVTTLCAAVLVTVLITYYLERHNQADRKEKDLLLRQLDLIHQLLHDFEGANEDGKLADIIASAKRLSVSNRSFFNILKEFKYSQKILHETDFDQAIREIWKLATDTPIKDIESHANRLKCNASVKEGIISLAADRKALLESKVNSMKSKIFKAQLIINRN